MNELSGTQLGQYQIMEVIGRGGMSTVYRAHQPSMERDVAIKVLSSELAADPEFMARFEREARIIAQLQHPHILTVYDFGRQDNLAYLVLRLVQGGSLAQELRGGRLPLQRVILLMRQIASALDYAHLRGIVHRDLKPTNVLLNQEGNAFLTDFGIAKMVTGGAATGLTQPGAVMGTPTYMAPEQWRSEPVDGRTDIYALGVMLYQMLLGTVPFAAETPHGLMYQHLDAVPPTPRSIDPHLPLGVEQVLIRALAKNREDRYASATQLAHDLEQALQGPVRLPEQTDFDAADSGDDDLDMLYDQLYEEELLAPDAQPPSSERPTVPPPPVDSRPTVPPPPVDSRPTVPRPAQMPAPPPPPPQSDYSPPPYQVPIYSDAPRYGPGRGVAMERGMLLAVLTLGGIILLGVLIVLGLALFGGGDDDERDVSPTPPASTATLPADQRPRVSVVSPSGSPAVNLGEPLTIEYTISDPAGISRVELLRFGRVLDSVDVDGSTTYQGTFDYQPDSTGTHTLEIVAYRDDIAGEPATITVYAQ